MPISDPHSWLEGAAALKAGFDSLRSAIGLLRDARSIASGTEQQKKVIEQALDHAERSAAVAEAEVAKALRYELCKCAFPPTIMLTVGHRLGRPASDHGPVFECPRCGFNTAAPFAYTRTAPPRRLQETGNG